MDGKEKNKNENILEKEPAPIIKYGTGIIFLFFSMGLLLASGISYNEVIKGDVVITTTNPPARISANSPGEIFSIHFQPGDMVTEGSILGVIKNSANQVDVEYLKQRIEEDFPIPTSVDSFDLYFPINLNLGSSIQPYYNEFLNAYLTSILQEDLGEDLADQKQKESLLLTQNSLIRYKKQQITEATQNLSNKKLNLERNEKLYQKGIISKLDFEKVEIDFNEERQRNFQLDQQYEELIFELKNIQYGLQSAKTANKRNESFQVAALKLSKQELYSKIIEWEEKYVLKSPIEGKLIFFDIWAKHQKVSEGDIIFSVVPVKQTNLIGKCLIPVKNSGKVKKGQNVILKLENYPFKDWGVLKGTVESISNSEVGDKKGYTVYLGIDELKTSYGMQLELNQELLGSAEILLEKISLFERIFYQFRYLWSNES